MKNRINKVNADAWERYRTIIKRFNVAKSGMPGILDVRYQQAPDNEENFATVTIKLDKACTFTTEAKTALALAATSADMVTMTTDGSKMWINFTVNDILKEDADNVH